MKILYFLLQKNQHGNFRRANELYHHENNSNPFSIADVAKKEGENIIISHTRTFKPNEYLTHE